jgi:hypothetical protein
MEDVIIARKTIREGIVFWEPEINLTELINKIKVNGSLTSYSHYQYGASVTSTSPDDFIRVSALLQAISEANKGFGLGSQS